MWYVIFYLYPRDLGAFTDHLWLQHSEIKMSTPVKVQLKNTIQSHGLGLDLTEIVAIIYHKRMDHERNVERY